MPDNLSAAEQYHQWGREALRRIEVDLRIPGSGLYAEEGYLNGPRNITPSFNWGAGVLFSAFAAAARVEPEGYLRPLREFAEANQAYWIEHNGLGAYDSVATPLAPDRYYDDNAWIVLDLVETNELTREPVYLARAEAAMRFILSGEDRQLGGGVFWRENERNCKNTCVCAPAATGALMLHRATGRPEYLDAARRIMDWTRATLQDADGLFFDHQRLDGTIEPTKWTYNAALPIRAYTLLSAATGQESYLAEARRIARAAEARWVDPETGAIADAGQFAVLLVDALLELGEHDGDPHWLSLAQQAVIWLWENGRDPEGRYPERWNQTPREPLDKYPLLQQAAAARAFWSVAEYTAKRGARSAECRTRSAENLKVY